MEINNERSRTKKIWTGMGLIHTSSIRHLGTYRMSTRKQYLEASLRDEKRFSPAYF
jgi:hypothetical protein